MEAVVESSTNENENENEKANSIPEGMCIKCPSCKKLVIDIELEQNLFVCGHCDHYLFMPVEHRLKWLFDDGDYEILFANLKSVDFLEFSDIKNYSDRLETAYKKGETQDAFSVAVGKIEGIKVIVGVNNFKFLGGSLGSVMGEKITRLFEYGIAHNLPAIVFNASGGARMQEATLSLMQMAKTSAVVNKYKKLVKKPYISVLLHPTTGGVSASYAFLGDFTFAEPNALIGFAGPRVIEQTVREKLPKGFQRSEFLFEKGMIDKIQERKEIKNDIIKVLKLF